jgi:NTE family protein
MIRKKVAIACQGGGTHAAFTWGVLKEILDTKERWDLEAGDATAFDVTALSGTSAGALCALATWYGLAPNAEDPECGTVKKAAERLDFLWNTFAATTPTERALNAAVNAAMELKKKRVPLPQADPYSVSTDLGLLSLSLLGAREQYLSFASLLDSLCPHFSAIEWKQVAQSKLRMLAGAIEIKSGNFEVFDSHKTLEELGLLVSRDDDEQYQITRWRMRRSLSLEGVAASGTLPEFLRAQRIPNMVFPTCSGETIRRDADYWDGLYSQNPPVRLLVDEADVHDKPDEIWVIRINPQEMSGELRGLEDIKDRENDLAGNLSLNAELDHILTMNGWIAKYGTDHPLLADRKTVTVRTLKMKQATANGMHVSTKLNRSRKQMETLYSEGIEVARQWLADWRARREEFDCYPNDARYPPTDVVGASVEATS